MQTLRSRRLVRRSAYAVLAALALSLHTHGQSTAAPAASAPGNPAAPASGVTPAAGSQNQPVVKLNPFEVQADSDTSYGALNSSSITRFNTPLNQLPVSADIFTKSFMDDVAATNLEDLIEQYGVGTGFTGSEPDASLSSARPGDRNGNANIQIRGLDSRGVARDGFVGTGSTATGYTTNFDLERVEVLRGPQALLYGAGGAGGIINTVSKQARFDTDFGSINYRVDQYGSKQAVLDYGYGSDKAAVRVAVLKSDQHYNRVFLGGPINGAYVQAAFKVLGNTTLRVEGEQTTYDHTYGDNLSLNANKTTLPDGTVLPADPRNGESLAFIYANGQASAVSAPGAIYYKLSATATPPPAGTPFPGGAIDNGQYNWGNSDSFAGWWSKEKQLNEFTTLTAETQWNSWLSSQAALTYQNAKRDRTDNSLSLAPPGYGGNPLGVWAVGTTPNDVEQPSRTQAARFSLLAQNHLFGGRAYSQTVFGADAYKTVSGEFNYYYYQADANFNVITTPGVTSQVGRTQLPEQWYSVAGGPVAYPLFAPGAQRITVGGVNYVRQLGQPTEAALISPNNPLGTTGTEGNYSLTHDHAKGFYVANFTQWLNDRLTTLAGLRLDRTDYMTANQTPPVKESKITPKSYNLGVDYALLSWLRAYYGFSDSYAPPQTQTFDPYGRSPASSTAIGHEVGLKFSTPSGSISGSLAFYHANSRNEQYLISSALLEDINPTGINGRLLPNDRWVNVNRTSEGVELVLTAAPTRHWRMRFAAAETDGRIGNTVQYAQLYNDQFYANSQGQVTYANGTVVWVPNSPSSHTPTVAPGAKNSTPLTLAMMNNPTSNYWAEPDADTGKIDNKNVVRALQANTQGLGTAATGVTGLPLSDMQIAWSDPNAHHGVITAVQSGDDTVGYPQYKLGFTNRYSFADGWLNGFSLGESVNISIRNRTYYYTNIQRDSSGNITSQSRLLYGRPGGALLNLFAGYTRKFSRVTWSAQLNVENLFNHYQVVLLPDVSTGVLDQVAFLNEPRLYVLSTTLSF